MLSVFKEQSKHIHFDAVYYKHKNLRDYTKTIDYTQVYKDFEIQHDQVDK